MQWFTSLFSAPLAVHATKAQIGKAGEDAAVKFLRKKGFRILSRNWRHKQWELDIICQDGDTRVFVEVKTRKMDGFSSPTDAMTPKKQQNIIRAAKAWLMVHNAYDIPCRFDMVSVVYYVDEGRIHFTLEHYEHAFELPSYP